MSKIIPWLCAQIVPAFPEPTLAPLTARPRGRLRLSPAQVLQAIQAYAVAAGAIEKARRFQPRRLPGEPGRRTRRRSLISRATVSVATHGGR